MMPSHRGSRSNRDHVRRHAELVNALRNELQKSVLLCELSKIHCEDISELMGNSKRLLDESKKLIQPVKNTNGV
jgi:CRISPR/Cas system-associated endoribonuclease Cas2